MTSPKLIYKDGRWELVGEPKPMPLPAISPVTRLTPVRPKVILARHYRGRPVLDGFLIDYGRLTLHYKGALVYGQRTRVRAGQCSICASLLISAMPYCLPRWRFEDNLWADDPDGGALAAASRLTVILFRLRGYFAPHGLAITRDPRAGYYLCQSQAGAEAA